MKKLLLTLACVASLGLWMSCSDANELDVTTHMGVDEVTYNYVGTVTATRYVYKPVELGTEEPASGKYYFISTSWDNEGNPVSVNKYFHNVWVADKTPVTNPVATIKWTTDTSGATQTNMTTYTFRFRNDSSESTTINKSGDTYFTSNSTVITLTAGTLDSTTFTIKELPYDNDYGTLPAEDYKYLYDNYEEDNPRYVYYGNITYTRGK